MRKPQSVADVRAPAVRSIGILDALAGQIATRLAREAEAALAQRQLMLAAVLFTEAADALPLQRSGKPTADTMRLRRNAHLALSQTPEFYEYRRYHRPDPSTWREPDGSLVRLLAPAHLQAREPQEIA